MEPGDLIIATGALRLTGTVDAYVDKSYPGVANHEVLFALIEAAEELGETYHVGLAGSGPGRLPAARKARSAIPESAGKRTWREKPQFFAS